MAATCWLAPASVVSVPAPASVPGGSVPGTVVAAVLLAPQAVAAQTRLTASAVRVVRRLFINSPGQVVRVFSDNVVR